MDSQNDKSNSFATANPMIVQDEFSGDDDMFLGEVINQERRSSSAIKMSQSRRASENPSATLEVQGQDETTSRRRSGVRRRSSIFRPPPPVDPTFKWRALDEEQWAIVQGDGSETSLVYRKNQTSSMKNFGVEVRGMRDVENLLQDAVIILGPKNGDLQNLIEEILEHVCQSIHGDEEFYKEVMENLFTGKDGQIFARTLQGYVKRESEFPTYDQSWLCAFCDVSQIKKRYVTIVRMKQPTNFGETCQDVRFFILVLCPSKTKETKSALETSRTFATLFSDPYLRNSLLLQPSEDDFKNVLSDFANKIASLPEQPPNSNEEKDRTESMQMDKEELELKGKEEKGNGKNCCLKIGSGIKDDILRRLPHYVSDYTDGISDARAIQKTISASVFLYFACLLPTIAFATLNSHTTHGRMDVRKGIFAQTVGQLIFAFIGGQHLSVLLTTAPLSLFVYIIFSLSEFYDIVDKFEAFYACVGIWMSFFLFLSALFNLSFVMKYCTRSTEEIFALFISIAFVVYAVKDTVHEFEANYDSLACLSEENVTLVLPSINNGINNTSSNNTNSSIVHFTSGSSDCHRDSSLLYLLLMFGTFWFGYTLYKFKNTPFLQRGKRELLSDYALPLSVIVFSFIGSFLFQAVPAQQFEYDASKPLMNFPPLHELPWEIVLLSGVLGFCLSVLIFMDQNIGSAIVNNPSNKLTKGASYNWDLVVISVINLLCSLFSLPWLHVALPHAPMHVKSLADIEERVEHGQVKQTIVRVRETRLTTILSHILMGLSLLLLPVPLVYILPSVFDGLYLYMGITALEGNQLYERFLLVFTEQMSYPPNHYIRQVPQRKIHQFTLVQGLQLLLLCVLGFSPFPFVKVVFPLVLLFLLYARQKLLPRLIEKKYLDVLDGH